MRTLIPKFSNTDISRWSGKKKVHTSIPFGKCVPLAFLDILPGDNIKTKIEGLIRMLTPKTQIMDSIYFDIYPYFVPRTQIDHSTKQFYGENETDAWTLHLDHKFPHFKFKFNRYGYVNGGVGASGPYYLKDIFVETGEDAYGGTLGGYSNSAMGTLLDHFGLPFVYINEDQYNKIADGEDVVYSYESIREEPFRVYQKIWNDDFRNPAIVDPVLNWSYEGADTVFTSDDQVINALNLLPAMKSKDLFTSLVISPERGNPVEISMLETAPLKALPDTQAYGIGGVGATEFFGSVNLEGADVINANITKSASRASTTNLVADLSRATATTIDKIRFAVASQHFEEWMTRSFRFKDFINIFFGVQPKSLEIDRPLRIGGLHGVITTNQVVQSSSTGGIGGSPLGSIGGYSATALTGYLGTLRADVPGTLMFIMVMRKAHAYVQGKDKYWSKETLLDTYLAPFKNIGYVALRSEEVYWYPENDDILGYTEYGYDYRYFKDEAHGLMNPLHPQSLSYSTLTDVFDEQPTLDDAFVTEDSSGLDNALIASASVTDQFYGTFHFYFDLTRKMNLYSIPGLDTF